MSQETTWKQPGIPSIEDNEIGGRAEGGMTGAALLSGGRVGEMDEVGLRSYWAAGTSLERQGWEADLPLVPQPELTACEEGILCIWG